MNLRIIFVFQAFQHLAANKTNMKKCAKFVSKKLKDAGMKKIKIIPTKGHPLVYGEWMKAPGKPTVLIYGHYDVQPVDPLNLWKVASI